MKSSDAEKKALENMQPGVITANGFLGEDTRPLPDIIEADEEQFNKLGLDWEAVAVRLAELIELGKAGLGEPVTVQNKWLIRVDETRGKLPSPWEDGLFRKTNAEVSKVANGVAEKTAVVYNDLSIHLLRNYHFLQGKGSSFRLEPSDIKNIIMI